MNDLQFRRHAKRLLVAWLALLALMFASLASSYLSLGGGNAAIGTGIALLKSAIVLALFMGLLRAGALVRIVAATALGTWLVLLALGGLDSATRELPAAPLQRPEQLPPLVQGVPPR